MLHTYLVAIPLTLLPDCNCYHHFFISHWISVFLVSDSTSVIFEESKKYYYEIRPSVVVNTNEMNLGTECVRWASFFFALADYPNIFSDYKALYNFYKILLFLKIFRTMFYYCGASSFLSLPTI